MVRKPEKKQGQLCVCGSELGPKQTKTMHKLVTKQHGCFPLKIKHSEMGGGPCYSMHLIAPQ